MTEKPENKEFTAYLSALRADIENLVRKSNKLGATTISGFILSEKPKSLIRFGNNGNVGNHLIQLHIALSTLAVGLEAGGNYGDGVSYADVGQGSDKNSESPEDVAYQLAKSVLVSGMEPEHAAQAVALAERYIALHKK